MEIGSVERPESDCCHGVRRKSFELLVLPNDEPNVCPSLAGSLARTKLTNGSSYQLRKYSKLKEHCAELQGEIENIWGQANQRITTLTTKIRGSPVLCKRPDINDIDAFQTWNEKSVR